MKSLLSFILCIISSSISLAQRPEAPVQAEITPALMTSQVDFSSHLKFSMGVSLTQKNTILADLNRLRELDLTSSNSEATAIFQTPLNTPNLEKWLADRAQYIVEENFDLNANVQIINRPIFYPKTPMPRSSRPTRLTDIDVNNEGHVIKTVMSNLGVALYLDGKEAGDFRALNIPGVGVVDVLSPRAGIFRIGALLFQRISQFGATESMAHTLYRLKTYFHEGRHTDGNGTSLGFLHAVCPPDHDYEGFTSCDKRTNGSYAVASAFLNVAIPACNSCSPLQKEALRVYQIDSNSRILTFYKAPAAIDEVTTETTATETTLSQACLALQEQGIDISTYEFCELRAENLPTPLEERYYQARPADPAPESAKAGE